ncbi:hypothetical protein EYF80_001106 [Liparis tanakae]|uniref:Uncharacterized protein n=1 Tax=Liparis tanakae TaxID=230148 RepID=A0A4Z2JG56_9TELE|nr:hypothetical protein EYF80_001106 [Liparis tanakae]
MKPRGELGGLPLYPRINGVQAKFMILGEFWTELKKKSRAESTSEQRQREEQRRGEESRGEERRGEEGKGAMPRSQHSRSQPLMSMAVLLHMRPRVPKIGRLVGVDQILPVWRLDVLADGDQGLAVVAAHHLGGAVEALQQASFTAWEGQSVEGWVGVRRRVAGESREGKEPPHSHLTSSPAGEDEDGLGGALFLVASQPHSRRSPMLQAWVTAWVTPAAYFAKILIVASAVPPAIPELVLALPDAQPGSFGHLTDDLRLSLAQLGLLPSQTLRLPANAVGVHYQRTAHRPGKRQPICMIAKAHCKLSAHKSAKSSSSNSSSVGRILVRNRVGQEATGEMSAFKGVVNLFIVVMLYLSRHITRSQIAPRRNEK